MPQYTYQEFAAALRQVHPELGKITDDGTLVHATLQTHPELKQHVIDPLEGSELAGGPGGPPVLPKELPGITPGRIPNPDGEPKPGRLVSAKTGAMAPITPDSEKFWPAEKVSELAGQAIAMPFQGAARAARGAKVASKYYSQPSRVTAGGVGDMIGGAMQAGTVFLPEAAVMAPLETMAGLGVGAATQYGVEKAGEAVGAPPEYTGLAADVAALGAGGLAAHAAGGPGRARARAERAGVSDQLAAEDAAARGDVMREHAIAQQQLTADLADETAKVEAEYQQRRTHAKLQIAKDQHLERVGGPFDYLGTLMDLETDPRVGPPPQVPALETIDSFRRVPPTPLEKPPLALPPIGGSSAPPQPTFIGRTGYGAPEPGAVDQVGAAGTGPGIAESAPPAAPDDLVNTLGEQLASQLEYQPPPGPPQPTAPQRVRMQDRQVFKDTRATIVSDMHSQMEDMPHVRGRASHDTSAAGAPINNYYTPPIAGSEVYWDIVGKDTKSPPTRATITDILKAYKETGADSAKDLPEGYKTKGEYGPREFKNAYDRWLPEVKKVADWKTQRRVVWEEVAREQDARAAAKAKEAAEKADNPDFLTDESFHDPTAEGGYEPEEPGAPPTLEGSAANRDLKARDATARPAYGNGQVVPEGVTPSELSESDRAIDNAEYPNYVVGGNESGGPPEVPRSLFDRLKGEEGVLNIEGKGKGKGGKGSKDDKPSAEYAYHWDMEDGNPPVPQYHVTGGDYHGSTVGVDRLNELGIPIPETPEPNFPSGEPPQIADLPQPRFDLTSEDAGGSKPPAQQSLFDRLKNEEGVFMVTTGPKDRSGLGKWLKKNEDEYGEEGWYQAARDAFDSGDTQQAWRIANIAAARSFAAAGGSALGKLQEQDTRLKAEDAPAIAKWRAQVEKQIGSKLPDSVSVSPEGILTFDFGGKGVPAVKARATDLALGNNIVGSLVDSMDPGKIVYIEGNENPNLRVNAQIADAIARREVDPTILEDVMDLTGQEDPVEIGRQLRRAAHLAGKGLNVFSQFVRENHDEFYHYEPVDETGSPTERGSVGALQASGIVTPDGFVKWLGGKASASELKSMSFELPSGVDMKNDKGELTKEAKIYARAWFRRQQRLYETQKTIDTLAPRGSGIDKAVIATTINPDVKGGSQGTFAQLVGLSKAALISKFSTAVRNTWSQAGRFGSGIVDDMLAGTFSMMTGEADQAKLHFTEAANLAKSSTREGGVSAASMKTPWQDDMQAIYDYQADKVAGLPASNIKKTLGLLKEFPHWETTYMGSLSLEGDRPIPGGSKSKLVNAITAPEVRNTLTLFNRTQEHAFRSTVFDATMRTQISQHGLDPDEILTGHPRALIDKLGEEEVDRMVGASTSAALDYTFAANPLPGTVPDMLLDVFSRNPVIAPLLQLGFPFPRFNFVSAPRWLWDHFPLAPLLDVPLAQAAGRRADTNPALRGRYFQMRQMEQQGNILTNLDTEIGRTEYDAAKHLGDFMAAKQGMRDAAKSLKAIEKRAENTNELPGLQAEMLDANNALHEQVELAGEKRAKWREAEERINNLKGQREKAKKSYTGLQQVGAARSPEEYYARVASGGAMLVAGYMIRQAANADKDHPTKWYEFPIKVPDLPGMPGHQTIVDLRAYAPQVQPLLLMDIANDIENDPTWKARKDPLPKFGDAHAWSDYMRQNYAGKYTMGEVMKDALEAYLSISPAAGSTKTIVDTITGRSAEGQPFDVGGVQDAMLATVGQFLGRFTSPLGMINDITGQFDEEAAKARIPAEGSGTAAAGARTLIDPAIANVPGAREKLIPEKTSPFSGEPITTVDPIARGFAGVTQRTQTQVEAEMKRTGLPYGVAAPRTTGDREFDNKVASAYAKLLNENFQELLDDHEYQSLTPELRRDILEKVFTGLKKGAYGAVAEEIGAEEAQGKLQSPKGKQKLDRWQKWLDQLEKESGGGPPSLMQEPGGEPAGGETSGGPPIPPSAGKPSGGPPQPNL